MSTSSSVNWRTPEIIPPPDSAKPSACLIFLHGLGERPGPVARAFRSVPERVRPGLRILIPKAPVFRIGFLAGYPARSWFDITRMDYCAGGGDVDAVSLDESLDRIGKWVATQVHAGIPKERIVLGGFSIGGAMASYAALEIPGLGGLIAHSSPIFPGPLSSYPKASIVGPRLFWGHARMDSVITPEASKLALSRLLAVGFGPAHRREYPGGHSVCPAMLSDSAAWAAMSNRNVSPKREGCKR